MGRGLGVTKRRGVSRYISKGKMYYRFRLKGKPEVSLPGEPYSPEFEEAYRRAMEGEVVAGEFRTVEGSMAALVIAFYSSAEWKTLKPTTKDTYRRIIERLREQYGERPVKGLCKRHVLVMRDKRADTPAAADNMVKVLSKLMDFAVSRGWRTDNPAKGIRALNTDSDGFPAWAEAEIGAFEAYWPVGTKERLAFDLLLYTAQRSGDVRNMGWMDVKDGKILVCQEKTSAKLALPIHARLKPSLDLAQIDYPTFIATQHGHAYTAAGFGNWFRGAVQEAGIKDRSAHGLRKSAATRLADAGCSEAQIKAITGHVTAKEVERYTKARDQRVLAEAAMAKI